MSTPPHSGESGDAFRIDDEILDPDHFVVHALEAKIASLDGKIAELERGAPSSEVSHLTRARALFAERLGIARALLRDAKEVPDMSEDRDRTDDRVHEETAVAPPISAVKVIPRKSAANEDTAFSVSLKAAEIPKAAVEAGASASVISRPGQNARRFLVPPGAIPQPRKYSSVKSPQAAVAAPVQKRSGQIVDRPPGMMSFLKHVQKHSNEAKMAEEAKAEPPHIEHSAPPPAARAPEPSPRPATTTQPSAGMSGASVKTAPRPDHSANSASAPAATKYAPKGNMLSYLEKMRGGNSAPSSEEGAMDPEKLLARPASVRTDVKQKPQETAPKPVDTDTEEGRENLKSELKGLFDEIK